MHTRLYACVIYIRHRAYGTKSVSELTSSYLSSLSSIKGPRHLCPTELGLLARVCLTCFRALLKVIASQWDPIYP